MVRLGTRETAASSSIVYSRVDSASAGGLASAPASPSTGALTSASGAGTRSFLFRSDMRGCLFLCHHTLSRSTLSSFRNSANRNRRQLTRSTSEVGTLWGERNPGRGEVEVEVPAGRHAAGPVGDHVLVTHRGASNVAVAVSARKGLAHRG